MGPGKRPVKVTGISDLPDELLLKVFAELAKIGPAISPDEEQSSALRNVPYRRTDALSEPHPGLRAYPFLAQVCKHWKHLLDNADMARQLWRELVIDFGHELITAVHTPIAWSDRRPSDDEFKQSFTATRLSVHRILAFAEKRRTAVRRLVMYNSEGYWMAENEYMSLQQKHNFGLAHFGMLLGMVRDHLEELHIHACNDFFGLGAHPLSAIACLPNLRVLRIEDVQSPGDSEGLCELSRLVRLQELVLTAEPNGDWPVGLDAIPLCWKALTQLTCLELRGHTALSVLPTFLSSLPLQRLDLSCCQRLDVTPVAALTGLTMLALHSMDLYEQDAPPGRDTGAPEPAAPTGRVLPKLSSLTKLQALQLSGNLLTRVPPCISSLSSLRYLDLSHNKLLKVTSRLRTLYALPNLVLVDFLDVHEEPELSCWSEEKGETMKHIAQLARQLKLRRNPYPGTVLANYKD